jgi:ATP-binding protein involved in chromosome partitioning
MPIPLKPTEHSQTEHSHRENDEFQKIITASDAQAKRKANLAGIKRIIGIHSGKGGVGKTFLACNIAYALAEHGLSIGILDCDIDCPNVPRFLNMKQSLFVDSEKRFKPVLHHGVKIISMGLTREDESEPFLLRGPAKHRVAIDLLTNSVWEDLDLLIIDLPPGTSDVPMSILEFGGMQGILYVTTPQKEAIVDTAKSIKMGKTFGLHIIGLVENMSGGVFGRGKAEQLAIDSGVEYLGSIPLNDRIFQLNEKGEIAFLDPTLEPAVKQIVDAMKIKFP